MNGKAGASGALLVATCLSDVHGTHVLVICFLWDGWMEGAPDREDRVDDTTGTAEIGYLIQKSHSIHQRDPKWFPVHLQPFLSTSQGSISTSTCRLHVIRHNPTEAAPQLLNSTLCTWLNLMTNVPSANHAAIISQATCLCVYCHPIPCDVDPVFLRYRPAVIGP